MFIARYQPLTPQSKPTAFNQSTSDKPSVYDFPDIKKAKFFKLKDFKEMNDKFNEELRRVERERSLELGEGNQVMDEELQEPRVNALNDSSLRLSSFDISRLQEKKKKTGFMFDCFNVFKKDQRNKQVGQYESHMIDESRYLPNNHFLTNNNSINSGGRYENKNNASFFNMSNCQVPNQSNNLKSSRPIQKQNTVNLQTIQNKPSTNNAPLTLSQKQLHQTHQIKLDFKLNMRKPQFCMGAFSHTQSNIFGSGVNLNISLPTLEQHRPFEAIIKGGQKNLFGFGSSCSNGTGLGSKGMEVDESIFNRIKQSQSRFFQKFEEKEEEKKQQPKKNKQNNQKSSKNPSQQQPSAYTLAIIDTQQQNTKPQHQQNISRALQFGLIQMQTEEISFIAHKQQQQHQQDQQQQNILTKSIFENYECLLKEPQYLHLPVWESPIALYNPQQSLPFSKPTINYPSILPINSFEISYQWHQQHLSKLQSQFSVKNDALYMIDDNRLFLLVSQMLQGIQNHLFMLDYDKLQWYIDMRGLRFQHTLRNSFVGFMEGVLKLGNMRARMEKAVEYMGLRPFRKVYFQVAKEVKNVFRVVDQYLLEFVYVKGQLKNEIYLEQSRINKMEEEQDKQQKEQQQQQQQKKHGFVQFFTNLQHLTPQIQLLYQLLICQQQIQKQKWSYFTFDHRFLHSQFFVFEKILKLSRQTDQTMPTTSLLTKRLLSAAFKPIISSLNRILFQEMISISSKQQIYLKYYYESTRQLFNQVSKKMQIIHTQSPQLYVVCKQKLQMGIQVSVQGLRSYQKEWSKLFLYKYTQLQAVLQKMMRKQHQQRHVKQKQKEQELQLLKRRLKEKMDKQIEMKMVEKNKRDSELVNLRKQIKEKEERKRLQHLIEKQAERGYLLEDQLKKKISLLKEKEKLMNQLDEAHEIKQTNANGYKQGQKVRGKQEQVSNLKDLTEWPKPKKQQNNNQMDEQLNEEKKAQGSKQQKQPKELQQLPLISQQTIILPIVNEQRQPNLNSQNQENQNAQQPKSPKSSRSRKIRKQVGNIRSRGKKQALPGRIYFNKKLTIPNLSSPEGINNVQSINFAQLCEKSKKLNFHLLQQQQPRNSLLQLQHQLQSSFSSSSQQSSLNQSQAQYQMQQQLYTNYAKDYVLSSKQQYIPTNCIFEICIDKILSNQSAVVNNCFEILVFQKYHFKQIVKFMKNVFFSQNGDNHRTLLSLSVHPTTSAISLKYFNNDCFLFDHLPQFLHNLKPCFYNTRQQSLSQIQQRLINFSQHGTVEYYGECNLIRQDLEQFVGFQFMNLPMILEPYFSYIHLSKYMQIFAFILRIKHCEMMIGESWLLLNEFKKELFRKQKVHKEMYGGYFEDKFEFETKLLNQLFVTRHIIQSFLTTYQNYIFFRVIEKEFKSLNKKIERNQLSQLQAGHLKLLDTIIRFAFVDNSVNNITKQIRKLLEYIMEFRNIVDLICSDDILEDQKAQVRTKVKFIHTSFKQNQKFFEALYFKT